MAVEDKPRCLSEVRLYLFESIALVEGDFSNLAFRCRKVDTLKCDDVDWLGSLDVIHSGPGDSPTRTSYARLFRMLRANRD